MMGKFIERGKAFCYLGLNNYVLPWLGWEGKLNSFK